MKVHVESASYHSRVNGKVERHYKEMTMLFRLYEYEASDIAEMRHVVSDGVLQILVLGLWLFVTTTERKPSVRDSWFSFI